MRKFLIPTFLMLVFAAPALAKPAELYPVPCDDLWVAVKDTLGNTNNYAITYMDDIRQRVSFLVVGALTQYTERVALSAKDRGCLAKATVLEIGPDNDEWRSFHHRLAKTLAKLQAAKPKAPAPATAPAPAPGTGQP